MRILSMTIEATAGVTDGQNTRTPAVRISPWVNEPPPDVRGILCARDLARLTRRPRWELFGLALIGKFPRKKRYRGRPIGWRKSEVLAPYADRLSALIVPEVSIHGTFTAQPENQGA
jgi:predicted DNA-binding transcriptional regulator AlpA